MPSNINPYNINGNYPIAGQDNDSQGFRDNFTNIRNNFTFAEQEIEELQSKAILKSPLSGNTTVDNDLNGNTISNAIVSEFSERWKTHTVTATSTLTIDFAEGMYHYIDMGTSAATITLALANFPTDAHARVRIMVYSNNPSNSIILPVTQIQAGRGLIQNITPYGETTDDIDTINFPVTGYRTFEIGSYPDPGKFYIVELQHAPKRKVYTQVVEGFNITVQNDVETLILNANATISTGNIVFPGAPGNGQRLTIAMTGNSVSNVSLTTAGGGNILLPITTMGVNSYASWTSHYDGVNTITWVRTG